MRTHKYPVKPTIALFIYDPKCSVQSGNGVIQALSPHYNFKLFSKNRLEDVFFDDVDMIVVPGGFGDADSYTSLFKNNEKRVKEFIAQGGRYLGICMGAYWAGSNYLNILESVDAVQYLKRPGTDTRRPHAKAIDVTWQGKADRMFWSDGCALVGPGQYETVATYANGDAMAIIQDRIGIMGCHPESTQFWYEKPHAHHAREHWHNDRHHHLLLNFVDRLIGR